MRIEKLSQNGGAGREAFAAWFATPQPRENCYELSFAMTREIWLAALDFGDLLGFCEKDLDKLPPAKPDAVSFKTRVMTCRLHCD
jgi:hypothetical protein